MKQFIFGAAMLTAAVAAWPATSSAQVSCESYMATVEEKMMQLSNDKQGKAMEHLAAAQKAMEENNEDKCVEELHLADEEIEANL
jgi:hypothetical protein